MISILTAPPAIISSSQVSLGGSHLRIFLDVVLQLLSVEDAVHNALALVCEAKTLQQIGTGEAVLFAPSPPAAVLQESASHWFWRIILVLTAWLNLHYHLPHHACILLLKVLRVIFLSLGQLTLDDNVPVTLTTTFRHLNLNDEFSISPTCSKCHRVYPSDSPASLKCLQCDIPLFKFWGADAGTPFRKTSATPILQCPRRLISEQLPRILNRVGIEQACEAWRSEIPKPGAKTTIMDGKIWQMLPGADGKLFFDNSPD